MRDVIDDLLDPDWRQTVDGLTGDFVDPEFLADVAEHVRYLRELVYDEHGAIVARVEPDDDRFPKPWQWRCACGRWRGERTLGPIPEFPAEAFKAHLDDVVDPHGQFAARRKKS